MKETIKALLVDVCPDIDFEVETNLIEDGYLSSMDLVSIVSMLEDEFEIEVSVNDFLPENFASLNTICAMVERLKK